MGDFVDVSGMTAAQVKRLWQQDEPDAAPTRRTKRQARVIRSWPTDAVFLAATVAHRVNGGQYIKPGTMLPDPTPEEPFRTVPHPLQPNRAIIDAVLAGAPNAPIITDADREVAQQIRQHFQGLYFRVMAGVVLNSYLNTIMDMANGDTVTENNLNWVASAPSAWARDVARQSVDERLNSTVRGWAAPIGSQLSTTAQVARCVYSQQWATYYVTAITADNHAVFFAFKQPLTVGSNITLDAKVKSHRDGYQTQLNYAKVKAAT